MSVKAKSEMSASVRLPPINKATGKVADPYINSKLMTFKLSRQKGNALKQLIVNNALEALEETKQHNEVARSTKDSEEPDYPKEMMSKGRKIRINYQLLKSYVMSAPITPMQSERFDNMLKLVPKCLQTGSAFKALIKELHEEVIADFEKSMQKSMVQHVLLKPKVKGLEDDDNEPPPAEVLGMDYSSPWNESYRENKEMIRSNLHILHPSMQTVLRMCQASLGSILLCNCQAYRLDNGVDFESLRNNTILECEKTEEKLMTSWLPAVINIYADKNSFAAVRADKINSFYSSVTTLMSNQLKDLLTRSISAWVNLFDEGCKDYLPLLRMELVYEDNIMQFYPRYEDLEELILSVVEQMSRTLQSVPTVQSWLSGGNTTIPIDAKIADHIMDRATKFLKEAVARFFEDANAHLQWFLDTYNYLINGEALAKTEAFISETHTFQEYIEFIDSYLALAKEIVLLPSIEHYDMILLDCEDLKTGLSGAALEHAQRLMDKVAADHHAENLSICEEFQTIKARALHIPETSEQLMEMIQFIEYSRSGGMIKLNARIKESHDRMQYLLDVYFFTPEAIEINKEVLTWPKEINPVFDRNDDLVEQAKLKGERLITEKREKVMMELQKLKQRCDEFNDFGELDMMSQYIQDVRAVQKRLAEQQEQIAWLNKEEVLFKMATTQFNEVEEINQLIDPFNKLFQIVFKWQRADKRWMDGGFLDLNSDTITAEVEDYWKDLYKIQKIFATKFKKLVAQKEELDHAKKKKVPTATLR